MRTRLTVRLTLPTLSTVEAQLYTAMQWNLIPATEYCDDQARRVRMAGLRAFGMGRLGICRVS